MRAFIVTSRCITKLVTVFVMLLFAHLGNAAVWVVTYPKPLYETDARDQYPIALLSLALDKTKVRYSVNPSAVPMRQDRAIRRLENNLDINVYWTVTDQDREQDLLPIRIPITKGLIGWRMFLSHKDNAFLSQSISKIEDLRLFTPVQGSSWADTKVLQANGFDVRGARDYGEAKAMVNEQLADTFPRSVIEIESELNEIGNSDLRLRDGIAIRYPSAMYFFVNKSDVTLAKLLQTGLERAIADGSFDALFHEYFGETIERLDIDSLKVFDLSNPELPPKTPLQQPALWYMPTLQ